MAALAVRNVSHAFGRFRALDDVSLEAREGEFTALLGVNGAGKSTLFNLITRLYDPRTGAVEVCGHDIVREPRAALSRLGIVFQDRALDPNLTVRQNLLYHAALHGIGGRRARDRADALLGRLELSDRAPLRVRALSGGQARRVEIARAMMHAPRLLLCDEASAGLDIRARDALLTEARRLARQDGVAVLWATHLIDEIEPADPVVILHRGKVLARGTAAEIAGADGLEAAFLRLTGETAA